MPLSNRAKQRRKKWLDELIEWHALRHRYHWKRGQINYPDGNASDRMDHRATARMHEVTLKFLEEIRDVDSSGERQ